MATEYLVCAVIVVLVLLLAVVIYRRVGPTRDRFDPLKDAAPPIVRDRMGDIQALLSNFSAVYASNVETVTDSPQDQARFKAEQMLAGHLETLRARLAKTPRTYSNCLAFYRGLCDSDRTFLRAADSFQAMATAHGRSAAQQKSYAQLAMTLRGLARACHNLGVALNVE